MINKALKKTIRIYQVGISPYLGTACRYVPTCSEYALEAIEKHGSLTGTYLTFKRICKCHPWGGHGHDPVPDILNKDKN